MKAIPIVAVILLLLYACATPVANTKPVYEVDKFYSLRVDGNDTLFMRREIHRKIYMPADTLYLLDKDVGRPIDIISYPDKFILVKFPSAYMIATYFGWIEDQDLEWRYFKTKKQFESYAKKYGVPLDRTENW